MQLFCISDLAENNISNLLQGRTKEKPKAQTVPGLVFETGETWGRGVGGRLQCSPMPAAGTLYIH